jgi:Sugar phosphate permease
MERKKSINLGFRGWMLVVYQAIAFLAYTVFSNYPLNILADFYGGAQKLSTIYTVCTIIGVLLQLALNRVIGKLKSIKVFGAIFGFLVLALGMCIMLIPFSNANIWCVCYAVENVVGVMYATFAIGILVGQWFPTRKGTIMGIATFAFPIGNGLIGLFAANVFKKGYPDVFGAFLPFFILCTVGWLIGVIFLKDYPEQCGCYRDNNKNMTPEIAKAMMEEEIENKKTSVWKLGATLKCGDFWLITVPLGFLLMFSVGMMTQTASIIGTFEEELAFLGGYQGIMLMICIVGCIGSYIMGVLDTAFGTKKAIIVSVIIMIIAGILGAIPNAIALVASLVCLAVFMGASSNFTVSAAAQYWRREDFGSVFSVVNPIANIFNAVGPMVIARLLYSQMGYQAIFVVTAVAGVISLIFMMLFRPSHVKAVDDRYRELAGKPLDNALEGRK